MQFVTLFVYPHSAIQSDHFQSSNGVITGRWRRWGCCRQRGKWCVDEQEPSAGSANRRSVPSGTDLPFRSTMPFSCTITAWLRLHSCCICESSTSTACSGHFRVLPQSAWKLNHHAVTHCICYPINRSTVLLLGVHGRRVRGRVSVGWLEAVIETAVSSIDLFTNPNPTYCMHHAHSRITLSHPTHSSILTHIWKRESDLGAV
jgi:hypothetical protein